MKVYRISSQNAQVEKSKALKRSGYITAAAVVVGLLLGGRGFFEEHDLTVLLLWGGFATMLVVFVVWYSLRRTNRFLADAYSSFEISSDDQTWTKKQKHTPEVTLAKSEVRRVEELQGKGFRICTDDRSRNIWVPSEVEGYEQLKAEVLAAPGVEFTSKAAAWMRTYLTMAVLMLLIALSVLATDKRIAAGASVVVGAYLVALLFKHYRNPNLTAKMKRQFLWSAFVGVCMLARAVLIWRS